MISADRIGLGILKSCVVVAVGLGPLACGDLVSFGGPVGPDDGEPAVVDPNGGQGHSHHGEDYVTYNPGYQTPAPAYDGGYGGWSDASSAADSGSVAAVDAGSGPADPSSSDPEREIVEADIVKIVGDRLYALSEYRGLLVVDVGTRDQLSMLGRYRTSGRPFEMYVQDDVAYVIYTSHWSWSFDETSGYSTWKASSRIIALDVSDPAQINALGAFDLAGEISDSRMVGVILYAVSYESGSCWGCHEGDQTVVTAIAVGDTANIHVVDRVTFPSDGYGYGPRSVTATTERMYVAGEEYGSWDDTSQSTIQVVDISSPTGDISLGASVEAAGQIFSRWQMNEHAGVLRVVSQPSWWGGEPPVVETFRVHAADDLEVLGRLELNLPRPEDLMSVQFDGDRGYVVTFERTDPLFLIDLSDPAAPLQRGELEMPGWLYHMVPAGDRLYAVGFDEGSGLAVSLFDVADLDAPSMLSRVSFGADWGYMPEDQDRIHKAFNILPELSLILMPFSGWSYGGGYHSGIQLIDIGLDQLTRRGVAPHQGQARRAIMHDGRLLAMSDERLEAFDIADRDAPDSTARITLARTVYAAVPAGGVVAELVSDWWTGEAQLELLPLGDPDAAAPIGSLDLSGLIPEDEDPYDYWYYSFPYDSAQIFDLGGAVAILWGEYSYRQDEGYGYRSRLATVDISEPSAPSLLASLELPVSSSYGYWWSGDGSLVVGGETAVLAGRSLVVRSGGGYYDSYSGEYYGDPVGLTVVDLSDPGAPVNRGTYQPSAGDEVGTLMSFGNLVVTAHRHVLEEDPRWSIIYLDRLDVSDPTAPQLLAPVNIPGGLAGIVPGSGRLITLELEAEILQAVSWDSCEARAGGRMYDFDYYGDECRVFSQRLNLLRLVGDDAIRLQQLDLGNLYIGSIELTGERLFGFVSSNRYYYYDPYDDDWRARLATFTIDNTAGLELASVTALESPYSRLTAAVDSRAVVVDSYPPAVAVVDAEDPTAPLVLGRRTLPGYAYQSTVVGDAVLTTCGPWGVAVTPLDGSLPF